MVGKGGAYFCGVDELAAMLDVLLDDRDRLEQMRAASLARFEAAFTWPAVLADYERLLARFAGLAVQP